jgi:uncharacterized protein YjbJ (UPF0337 family)
LLDYRASALGLGNLSSGEESVNWNIVEGKWDQIKGRVRQKWAKLTDDDVENLKGKRDRLVGKIKERYGLERDEAEREVDDFIDRLN